MFLWCKGSSDDKIRLPFDRRLESSLESEPFKLRVSIRVVVVEVVLTAVSSGGGGGKSSSKNSSPKSSS